MDLTALLKREFLFPPFLEQKKIATILSSVDETIEQTQTLIAQIDRVKQALLIQLFAYGLPGRHNEFKTVKAVGHIPKDWDVARLDEIAEVERGKFAHRPRNDPRFYGGIYPFVQTGDVTAAHGRLKAYTQTLNDLGLSVSRLFPAGTVLVTIAANIGETAIADFSVAFPDSVVGIVPKSAVTSQYIEYFLRVVKSSLDKRAPESARKNINLETLRPLLIPVPDTREREGIVSLLNSVEGCELNERDWLKQLQLMKSSLMEVLLSGKKRVTLRKSEIEAA